jgi:tetratricopeptide (TPR) repeat protein
MEPITVITTAILSQLQTTTLIGTLVSGLIGKGADAVFSKSSKHILDKIKNQTQEPANHDLQKAIRRAYLKATLLATQQLKSDEDALQIKTYLKEELRKLNQDNCRFASHDFENHFEHLLKSKGNHSENGLSKMILSLKESLFFELKTNKHRMPLQLKEIIFHGWKENGRHLDWYELICAFATEEFKENPRVRAVVQTDYLSAISKENNAIKISVDDIIKSLESYSEIYLTLIPKIESLLLTSERTEQKVDSIEQKIDSLTKTIYEQSQQNKSTHLVLQNLTVSSNYKKLKTSLVEVYKQEEDINQEIEDYTIELQEANEDNYDRKKRLLNQAEINHLKINEERIGIEKTLEIFINDVLQLAKILETETIVTTPEINDIQDMFNRGDYDAINNYLSEKKLYNELQDNNKKREELAQKFIIKAQTLVINKPNDWFEQAKKYFHEATNICESFNTCFEFASYLNSYNQIEQSIFYYKKCLEYNSEDQIKSLLLSFIANNLRDSNNFIDAKKNYLEALSIGKKLALKNPSKFLPDIAWTLKNLGVLQRDNNELFEAERNLQEALKIRYKLAKENPKAFSEGVATVLNDLATVLTCNNKLNEAEKNYLKALRIIKMLNREDSEYLANLSAILTNLASLQCNVSKNNEAEKNYSEALNIYKKLAEDNPYSYLENVAHLLNNIAILQVNNEDFIKAKYNTLEALNIYKKLAEDNAYRFLDKIASVLNNLAVIQFKSKDFIECKKHFKNSLEIRTKLSQENPNKFDLDCAESHLNLAELYAEGLFDKEKSIVHANEVIKYATPYIKDNPLAIELKFKTEKILNT